ncbi:MAG: ATP-binding cassette domain-containing protein [Candidatus Babeliales bacterium]|nr:ATP-binding cassette domain-containing protein [Candidatus Babeliales bacterium]
MLKLENVNVKIRDKNLLNNINVIANQGDFIVILGHNGAGKSTLLKTILGKMNLTSGNITLNNINLNKLSQQKRALLISNMSQDPKMGTVDSMTVEENLAIALYKGKKTNLQDGLKILQNSEILKKFLSLFGENILKTKVLDVSGGQRQMLAFIMATAKQPELLILDEPTAALDPISSEDLLNLIKTMLSPNLITLMITHDLDHAVNLGNKIWILKNGIISAILEKNNTNLTIESLKKLL